MYLHAGQYPRRPDIRWWRQSWSNGRRYTHYILWKRCQYQIWNIHYL